MQEDFEPLVKEYKVTNDIRSLKDMLEQIRLRETILMKAKTYLAVQDANAAITAAVMD